MYVERSANVSVCDLHVCTFFFPSSVKCVETWTTWNWETQWSTLSLRERETKLVLKRLLEWLQVGHI